MNLTHPGQITVASLLLALGIASAQSATLNDARSAVRQGTTQGIEIIPARQKASAPATATPAAAVASGPNAATSNTPDLATTNAARPAQANSVASSSPTTGLSGLIAEIRATNPPTGEAMHSAKRLESRTTGIAVPTQATRANPAAQPASSAK